MAVKKTKPSNGNEKRVGNGVVSQNGQSPPSSSVASVDSFEDLSDVVKRRKTENIDLVSIRTSLAKLLATSKTAGVGASNTANRKLLDELFSHLQKQQAEKQDKKAKQKKYNLIRASIIAIFKLLKAYMANGRLNRIFDENEMNLFKKEESSKDAADNDLYNLNKYYHRYKSILLDYLKDGASGQKLVKNNENKLKLKCLNILFELIKMETNLKLSQQPISDANDKKQRSASTFPTEFFNELIKTILTNNGNSENKTNEFMLKKLKSFLTFNDIRYFTLKYLKADFFREQSQVNETILNNLISLFCLMPGLVKDSKPPAKKPADGEQETIEPAASQPAKKQKTNASFGQENKINLVKDEEENLDEILGLENGAGSKEASDLSDLKLFALKIESLTKNGSKLLDQDSHRKLYNDCLVSILKCSLNRKQYKNFLIKLPEKILVKMSNPLMLANYLTESYNNGKNGLISLLSLNSLFILISSYNLEYPNFYSNVYALIDSSLFLTKYKDRFFQLLDLFLMSTHLSVNLAASFIKKLSRMCLSCPPGDLKFMILFILNLLERHRNCKVLVHNNRVRRNQGDDSNNYDDPFDTDTNDFNKTNALKSSLWEIQALKSHYLSYVSSEVEKLNNISRSNGVEYPLDDAFEHNSYEEYDSISKLFERELNSKKAPANCALNFNANAELVLDSKQKSQSKIDYLNLNKAEAKVSNILQF